VGLRDSHLQCGGAAVGRQWCGGGRTTMQWSSVLSREVSFVLCWESVSDFRVNVVIVAHLAFCAFMSEQIILWLFWWLRIGPVFNLKF